MRKISRREVTKGIGAGVGAVASPGILRAATKPLIIRRRWPFGSYDPAFCQNFEDAAIAAAALAPLLRFKPRAKDQDRWETEPHLVDSWTIGSGGKDYAFRLRDETWKASNSQIVSKDIAFSFGRLAAKNNLPNAYAARDIAKIQTPDPRSLQILMQSAVEAFDTSFLATGYAAMLPEAQWGGRELSDFVFNAPDHIGAYDIEPKDSVKVVLTANASWAGAKPKTDKIVFQVIQDDKAAKSMSKHGYIDVFEVPRDFAAVGRDPPDNWTASSVTTGRVVYLALFPEGPSLRSPEARRGIQLSLDKETLARTVYGGQWATPASSLAPSGWVWTSEREALERSAADAENFLKPLRDKTLNLAFLANLFPDPAALPAVAASIADGLRKRGVRVEFDSAGMAALLWPGSRPSGGARHAAEPIEPVANRGQGHARSIFDEACDRLPGNRQDEHRRERKPDCGTATLDSGPPRRHGRHARARRRAFRLVA